MEHLVYPPPISIPLLLLFPSISPSISPPLSFYFSSPPSPFLQFHLFSQPTHQQRPPKTIETTLKPAEAHHSTSPGCGPKCVWLPTSSGERDAICDICVSLHCYLKPDLIVIPRSAIKTVTLIKSITIINTTSVPGHLVKQVLPSSSPPPSYDHHMIII